MDEPVQLPVLPAEKSEIFKAKKKENAADLLRQTTDNVRVPGGQPAEAVAAKPQEKLPDPKKADDKSKDAAAEKKDEQPKQKENSKNEQNVKPAEPDPPVDKNDPAFMHIAHRIITYTYLIEYLKECFSTQRKEDIDSLEKTTKAMKDYLSQMKSGKIHSTIQEIDAQFPGLTATNVIGMPRVERNKKIQALKLGIKQQIDSIAEKNLKGVYTTHYLKVLTILKEIEESQFGIIPKIEKKVLQFPYADSNPQLTSSQILFKAAKIYPVKASRYFYLRFEFEADGAKYNFDSPYCADGGKFDWFNIVDLDQHFGKALLKTSVKITLFKKKFFFSSRLVSFTNVPLDKLLSLCTVKTTVAFPYKNNSTLNADIVVQVRKAFGKAHKEIEILAIEHMYPIFSMKKEVGKHHDPQFGEQKNESLIDSKLSREELSTKVNSAPDPKPPSKNAAQPAP